MTEALKIRIVELEAELKGTKVNKKTEMAVGQLKAKIAKFKEDLEKKSSGGAKGVGYAVKKEGDATVGFLGKPSVGKSTLLTATTNRESKIAAYEFTTVDVIPGLLHHRHTNLQLLDLPGIIDKASDNRGFGKKVLSVVRVCDLVVFVVDARHLDEMDMLLTESYNAGIRVNTHQPYIEVKRVTKGGISIPMNQSKKTISNDTIVSVMHDKGIINGEVLIHESNLIIDDLIDAVYGNLEYKKGVICINKIDLFTREELQEKIAYMKNKYPKFPLFGVSAEQKLNIEGYKDFLWYNLDFIWVYLKEMRYPADMTKPLVVTKGDSVEEVCLKIHKDVLDKFKFAKIKGKSAKFEWQRVGLEHIVEDGDIIEIYAR